MTQKLGSILYSRQKETPKTYTKWKAVTGRRGQDKKIIDYFFFGGQKGSIRQITSLVLARKFQTDQLRLYSWERWKLLLVQVLSWSGDMGIALSDSIGGLLAIFKQFAPFDQTVSLTERCHKKLRHQCPFSATSLQFSLLLILCVIFTGHGVWVFFYLANNLSGIHRS